jgi:serine/threonine-protein kinase
MAVPFDQERLQVTGVPVELLKGVATDTSGKALYSFSQNGVLVYVPGGPDVDFRRLVFIDRTGDRQAIPLEPRAYWDVRVSPDGRWLVLHVAGANDHIWLYEMERETLTRLTSVWTQQLPRWTPEGHRVTFTDIPKLPTAIFWKPVDGSGPEEKIHSAEYPTYPNSWSPDGRLLAYEEKHPTTRFDIWFLSLNGEPRTQPLLVTEFNEMGAEFSPDGRWLAYCSDETGRFEVYVRPVSGTGRRVQISTDGGDKPGWSPDGSEIYYRQEEKMMAVPVQMGEELVAGKPEMLFEIERDLSFPQRSYGITPDGRFVMIQPLHAATSNRIHVVLNWHQELLEKAPVK